MMPPRIFDIPSIRYLNSLLIAVLLCLFLPCCREKKEVYSGNPILDGWYADPEVVVVGDHYWIFPTYSASFDEQVFLDAFSSTDLVHWKKHERIVDTSRVAWAERAIWAPSMIEKDGRYFLFFSANDIQNPDSKWWNPDLHHEGMVGGIGVAISSSPQGPYTDYIGKPLINEFYNGAQPIDQFVFEDDGEYYIIYGGWGRCNIGKLTDDFTSLIPFDTTTIVKEITPEGYVEGPVMFRRNGWYYLMWSEGNWTDDSYRVAYGRSRSIDGPFQKAATVLRSDTALATGAGHHSVLNIPGTDTWYIVYHRRPIPNEGRDHRVTCIEEMLFDSDGNIVPIQLTSSGVLQKTLK